MGKQFSRNPKNTENSRDFVEIIKTGLVPNEIYVFTPKEELSNYQKDRLLLILLSWFILTLVFIAEDAESIKILPFKCSS